MDIRYHTYAYMETQAPVHGLNEQGPLQNYNQIFSF